MNSIKRFVEEYYAEHHESPSISKISEGVGVVRSCVYNYLREMDKQGILRYDGKSIRTAAIDSVGPAVKAPLFSGSVPCGSPEQIEAESDGFVSLPSELFGKGSLMVVRTKGDSMDLAGVPEGSFVVAERRCDAKAGDIVIALNGEGENTLKCLAFDEERQCYYLHPESSNPAHQDQYVSELRVQAVAKYVIARL